MKSKEFNVKVESTNDIKVVKREEAIKEAKRQIKELLEDGYTEKQIYVVFIHEETGEGLGSVALIDHDTIQLNNVDPRISTLKALLS